MRLQGGTEEETRGDRLTPSTSAVTPVTPAGLPSNEVSPFESPLSHRSPLQKDGTCTESNVHDVARKVGRRGRSECLQQRGAGRRGAIQREFVWRPESGGPQLQPSSLTAKQSAPKSVLR